MSLAKSAGKLGAERVEPARSKASAVIGSSASQPKKYCSVKIVDDVVGPT